MKNANLLRISLSLVLAFSIGFFLPSTAMTQQPIELKFVTAFDQNRDHEKATFMFIDMVKKYAGNRVKFVNKGGPESIPPFEQIEALRKGVYDFGSASYYQSLVPEMNALRLCLLHPWELRLNGEYDLYRKICAEKANVHYLGWCLPTADYHIYSRVMVKKTSDFRGMKIRSTPTYKDFLVALGAVPITTAHSEIYTALERGVVDAVCSPSFGVTELGWHEHIKYIVNPAFYQNNIDMLFNLDTWKRLPEDLRKLFDDIMTIVERDSGEFIMGRVKETRAQLLKAGIKEIMLEDKDKYLAISQEAAWKDVLSKCPQYGPELKRLFTNCSLQLK